MSISRTLLGHRPWCVSCVSVAQQQPFNSTTWVSCAFLRMHSALKMISLLFSLQVLKGLSMSIAPGEVVALVGSSGECYLRHKVVLRLP